MTPLVSLSHYIYMILIVFIDKHWRYMPGRERKSATMNVLPPMKIMSSGEAEARAAATASATVR